jgi:hypothetical protein
MSVEMSATENGKTIAPFIGFKREGRRLAKWWPAALVEVLNSGRFGVGKRK